MKPVNTQTIFITGSTDGIGKLTALQLAKQNAHILIHGRNEKKVTSVVEEIKNVAENKNVEGFVADFSALGEVRKLANEVLKNITRLMCLSTMQAPGLPIKDMAKMAPNFALL